MEKKLPVKEIFFILLCIILIIIFTPLLQSTFDTIIEKFKLDKVVNSLFFDILVLVTTWIFISIWVNKCSETIPNRNTTLLLLLVSCFYTYQRFFNNHFYFESFKSIDWLKYFDVIYTILLADLGGYLKYAVTKNPSKKHSNLLEEDSPIENNEDDELDGLFSKTVVKIRNIIENNNFKTSYTIGINGEWGSGKSSILSMLKKRLRNHSDKIIVDFNPWMGFDKKVLVKDFFNSLSESLTENNISNEVSEYTDELINATDNSFLKAVKNIFYKEKSLETLFDKINEKIKQLNKKIIVIVDDIDRLDNEEIFQLLKLIRNTANFNNTYFIMAYDREYVVKSISGINEYSSIEYLDKIINTELTLPYYDKSILKEVFRIKLINKIGEKYIDKINYSLDEGMNSSNIFENDENSSNDFIDWVDNIRQIKKLVNSICINFNEFFNEINFTDLIYIELLKLKYPYLYKSLYLKKNIIFKERSGRLYLKELDEKHPIETYLERNKTSFETKKSKTIDDTILGDLIKNYCKQNDILEIEKKKIQLLVLSLFEVYNDSGIGFSGLGSKDVDKRLSISYSYKFERYFSQSIFKGNISEYDFNNLLNSDELDRKTVVKRWIEEGKEKDLKFRLLSKGNYKNNIEFENTVKSILQLVHTDSKIYKNQKIGFDIHMFRWTIQYHRGDNKIIGLYDNKDDLKNFITKIFYEAKYPYLFESNVLSSINSNVFREDSEFILGMDKINDILKFYILKYLNEINSFDVYFWRLYNKCKKMSIEESYKIFTVYDEVKAKIIDLLKDSSSCIYFMKSIIDMGMDDDVGKIHKETIEDIFETVENFERLILNDRSLNCDSFMVEFKDFYYKVKDNNWSETNYDFQYFKRNKEFYNILTEKKGID
ncbi:MAG: AAA family ATPase [Bacteroidetes bacterium]|nr:AAA family ATPase [Bacteroidota bacterium]